MKNIAILIAVLMSMSSIAQVVTRTSYQDVRTATDKIETLEVAFITQELDLTTDEAQKFWPIFNDIKEERNNLIIEKKKLMYDMAKNFQAMTEQQAQVYVDRMLDIETSLNESNFESRHRKIIKIIGNKRFLQLKKAESDFRKKLLREYRGRRN